MIKMKKLLISALLTILFTFSGLCCFATGTEIISISQIELTDYIIIAGAIIFIIGAALTFLALFLKPSAKKNKASDEEYDDEDYDINILYEDEADNDISEAEDYEADSYPDEEDFEPALDDETSEDDFSEEAEDYIEPEIIEEETIEENSEDTDEPEELDEPSEEADEPETENEPTEEADEPEDAPTVKSVRLILSGTNNPDLKMIDITDSITAGRRSTNDLLISDSAVSGEHCRLTYDGEALFIEDLNSTNGTFVNGEQIEKAELKSGDTIILGQKQYRITIS